MKNLEHFYRVERGWSAGPHLFVAPEGIWVFTPLTTSGVHSPSWNTVSWGVEMVGDFQTEEVDPNVLKNTISALATLYVTIGRSPDTLKLHKEDPNTTHKGCPGKNVTKALIIQLVTNAILSKHGGEHPLDAFDN